MKVDFHIEKCNLEYYIRSEVNGFVLDLVNGATSQRTLVVASLLQNGTGGIALTQLWYFNSDKSIQSAAVNFVIDIDGGIHSTNLHLWPRYNAQNQEWIVNNSYILCPYSNRAMTMANSNVTSGVTVTAQTINFSAFQRWNIHLH